MKRVLHKTRVIFIVFMLFILPIPIIADEFVAVNADGKYIRYNTISADEVEVTAPRGEDYSGDIKVPATVVNSMDNKTYKITAVDRQAFSGKLELISVELPDAVTSIGLYAFSNCSKLESVNMPASLTYIGENAFYYCSKLEGEFVFPSSLTTIKTFAFFFCENITGSFVMPPSVKSIESNAFAACFGMTSLTINNNITTIYDRAFYGCSALKAITIGKSVTDIGDEAFSIGNNRVIYEIYCYPVNPPSILAKTFNPESQKNSTLYVPIGSKVKYQNADHWKDFANIVETDFSGVENAEMDKDAVNVSIVGGNLNISGADEAAPVQIYSTSGALINSTIVGALQGYILPHGVYIVSVNGKSHKIAYN